MPICKHCKISVSRYQVLEDAAGVFCGFWCGSAICEAEIKKGYNPRIFTDYYNPDRADVEWPDDY